MRFSSNNQIVTVNPIMGFESDEEVKYKIWGPYYGFALSTLQIFPYDKEGPKSKIYLNFLPNIVAICLLLARGIYMIIRMGGAMVRFFQRHLLNYSLILVFVIVLGI